jgi:dual specificity phosphatase 12
LILDLDHPAPFSSETLSYHFCPLVDDESDDVLLHIEGACNIIDKCLMSGRNVLVHCAQGVSRSVTIITGYIMKQQCLDFTSAYDQVCSRYPVANMADNFREQLRSYGTLYGWDMNQNTQAHRLFRAKHRLKTDTTSPEVASHRFLCRKCRQSLFLDIHCVGSSHENYRIEAMAWMSDQIDSCTDGPLMCPRCSTKLGNFNWCGLMGEYDFPGFLITASKVDRMPLTCSFKGDGSPKTKF